jgi:hypothetical protein
MQRIDDGRLVRRDTFFFAPPAQRLPRGMSRLVDIATAIRSAPVDVTRMTALRPGFAGLACA